MTLAELHRRKGIHQGDHSARLTIAQNLLRKGIEPTLVAETTGVDSQTIKDMAAEVQVEKV